MPRQRQDCRAPYRSTIRNACERGPRPRSGHRRTAAGAKLRRVLLARAHRRKGEWRDLGRWRLVGTGRQGRREHHAWRHEQHESSTDAESRHTTLLVHCQLRRRRQTGPPNGASRLGLCPHFACPSLADGLQIAVGPEPRIPHQSTRPAARNVSPGGSLGSRRIIEAVTRQRSIYSNQDRPLDV